VRDTQLQVFSKQWPEGGERGGEREREREGGREGGRRRVSRPGSHVDANKGAEKLGRRGSGVVGGRRGRGGGVESSGPAEKVPSVRQ
jgi:hypothetical protein